MLFFNILLCTFLYQICDGSHIYRRDIKDDRLSNDSLEESEPASRSDEDVVTDVDPIPTPEEDLKTDGDPTPMPDENPLTDVDPTPEPEEDPITDVPTPKPGEDKITEGDCPPDKSLHSRKDVGVIIDYVYQNLRLNETLMERLIPAAEDVKSKHEEDFDQFVNWIVSKPENLKQVLQGLSNLRKQKIEPEAQKVAIILKEYPPLKELVDEKQLKKNNYSKKLDKYENLCKYACDQEPVESRIFKRSIPNDFICSSIADLHNNTTVKLSDKSEAFLKDKLDYIKLLDTNFTEEIKKIKADLKAAALKEYGLTMYDVLNFEDDFNRFVNETNSTNIQKRMYDVKDVGLQIDSKLLQLQQLIEEYGKLCKSCSSGPARRFVRQIDLDDDDGVKEEIKDPIPMLDELIDEKYSHINNETDEILNNLFKGLIELIDNPEKEAEYLEKLKSLEKDIVDDLNIEKEGLDSLKSIAPQTSLKQLSELLSFSQDLLQSIDEEIKHVNELLHKNY